MYLNIPNIGYVDFQFMNNPSILHEKTLFKLIRFLKNSSRHEILQNKNNNLKITGFCIFDWIAACPKSKKPINGF